MDAPEPRGDAQASRLACAVTLGFVLVTALGTVALAAPPSPVVLAVVVAAIPAVLLAWREMARRVPAGRSEPPARDMPVRLLFVERAGDQLIVDGVKATLGPAGQRVDAPFALCLKRPPTLLVEDRFLQLLRRSTQSGSLEVTVNATQARFRTGDGQIVLPLTGTTGWSVADPL